MNQSIIIFDGVCNLCNASINFIIKHDHAKRFTFATTQSKHGARLLNDLGIDPKDPTTFVYIDIDDTYLKSDAAVAIAKHLRRPWSGFNYLRFIPQFIRDFAYSLIAQNRYKLLGKREVCMIPSPELKARFLD